MVRNFSLYLPLLIMERNLSLSPSPYNGKKPLSISLSFVRRGKRRVRLKRYK